MTPNTQYKDRLFHFIFGNEEHKDWTLSLYNAINGSSYSDPDAVEITTIKQLLFLSMHNDTSFLINDELNLYEHQSSLNPNLPLRMMQYTGKVYAGIIAEQKLNIYGSRLIRLPTPKLVVFYNGRQDTLHDEVILRLEDAFPDGSDPDIRVRVRMININAGKSPSILDACQPLKEYAWLVRTIRQHQADMSLGDAIIKAVSEAPSGFILKPFLNSHLAEVSSMLLEEYNEAEVTELFRLDGKREGLEEGLEKGLEQGRKEGQKDGILLSLRNLVTATNFSVAEAMKILSIPAEEQEYYLSRL